MPVAIDATRSENSAPRAVALRPGSLPHPLPPSPPPAGGGGIGCLTCGHRRGRGEGRMVDQQAAEGVRSRVFPGSAANLPARLESLAYEVFQHPAMKEAPAAGAAGGPVCPHTLLRS